MTEELPHMHLIQGSSSIYHMTVRYAAYVVCALCYTFL